MQILIPMSGFGERFRRVGYKVPKPLIIVDELRFIEHVVNMFSKNDFFIFICNKQHLNNKDWKLEELLNKITPKSKILGIEPHKYGPIHAVLKAKDLINNNEPIVVNYCDFTCYWNWEKFKEEVEKNDYLGALPAYKGFHPHSLGTTNYAYIKEKNNFLIDIKEKEPFTENRINEYASSGTYYFSKGSILINSCEEVIKRNLHINGEYYVSLAYKILAEKHKNIFIYPLQHFMQWGTPEDLKEYQEWSKIFHKLTINDNENSIIDGTLIIPMAGLGKRFLKEGYKKIKPLIEVSGKPMISQAIKDLPLHNDNIFVVRKDMKDIKKIKEILYEERAECKIITLDKVTNGQAKTVLEGVKVLEDSKIKSKFNKPTTISACDNGVLFNKQKLKTFLDNKEIDIIVWGYKNFINASRNPEMYGWIDCDDTGKIRKVSVKKPINNDLSKPIIIGTFTFKNINQLKFTLEELISLNIKVNDEFYVDSCINIAIENGLNCHYFEVDNFLCWGTPDDLKTFEYWQSCFHKWKYHKYRIEKDNHIPQKKIRELEEKIYKFKN